jgi:hypothetical protein
MEAAIQRYPHVRILPLASWLSIVLLSNFLCKLQCKPVQLSGPRAH